MSQSSTLFYRRTAEQHMHPTIQGSSTNRLTGVTVNCSWHGAALISQVSLANHLGGSLPGVVPPFSLDTHRAVATTTDAACAGPVRMEG